MRRYVEFVDQIHLPFPPRMRATSKGERVSRALQVCVAPAARVKFSDGNHQQRRREEPQSPQVKMNPTLYNMPRVYSTLATKNAKLLRAGRCGVSPVLSGFSNGEIFLPQNGAGEGTAALRARLQLNPPDEGKSCGRRAVRRTGNFLWRLPQHLRISG